MSATTTTTNSELSPSFFIPRVFTNITREKILEVFTNLGFGEVSHIDMVLNDGSNGPYYSAYVHYHKFEHTLSSDAFISLCKNRDCPPMIYYNGPYYWKVLMNTGIAKHDMPAIKLGDTLNIDEEDQEDQEEQEEPEEQEEQEEQQEQDQEKDYNEFDEDALEFIRQEQERQRAIQDLRWQKSFHQVIEKLDTTKEEIVQKDGLIVDLNERLMTAEKELKKKDAAIQDYMKKEKAANKEIQHLTTLLAEQEDEKEMYKRSSWKLSRDLQRLNMINCGTATVVHRTTPFCEYSSSDDERTEEEEREYNNDHDY